ncbi:MAG: cofactor assembly of complex C subunit B [Scytolyngbya sp. HA4215-MV1]|nr:cofactor assembly of complex C subunit B [Scytolyngbya sp. HA4215-MV1]
MTISVLVSTFLLTFLMAIGLFFFIRASVKDRTEEERLVATQSQADLLDQVQQYFVQRAYLPVQSGAMSNQLTFEGFVRPSLFLAIFLSFLAAVGILCLVLVLSLLLPPQFSTLLLSLVLLAPGAGVFYWRSAARPERVSLKIDTDNQLGGTDQTFVKVVAHRDELAALKRAFQLKTIQ